MVRSEADDYFGPAPRSPTTSRTLTVRRPPESTVSSSKSGWQRVEPLPREPTLTPPTKHSIPAARDRLVKAAQPRPVARQTVEGVVPPQHAAQPAMLRVHRCVHAAAHLRLDLVQLSSHALALGPPLDHKAPVSTPRSATSLPNSRRRVLSRWSASRNCASRPANAATICRASASC